MLRGERGSPLRVFDARADRGVWRTPIPRSFLSLSLSLWVSKSINNLYHLIHSQRESPYVPVSPYRGPALTRGFPLRSGDRRQSPVTRYVTGARVSYRFVARSWSEIDHVQVLTRLQRKPGIFHVFFARLFYIYLFFPEEEVKLGSQNCSINSESDIFCLLLISCEI